MSCDHKTTLTLTTRPPSDCTALMTATLLTPVGTRLNIHILGCSTKLSFWQNLLFKQGETMMAKEGHQQCNMASSFEMKTWNGKNLTSTQILIHYRRLHGKANCCLKLLDQKIDFLFNYKKVNYCI